MRSAHYIFVRTRYGEAEFLIDDDGKVAPIPPYDDFE